MTDTVTAERDRLFNQSVAACTEDYWEFIRANISAADVVYRCRGRGVTVTESDIRESRMRDQPCPAFDMIQRRKFEMVQPC